MHCTPLATRSGYLFVRERVPQPVRREDEALVVAREHDREYVGLGGHEGGSEGLPPRGFLERLVLDVAKRARDAEHAVHAPRLRQPARYPPARRDDALELLRCQWPVRRRELQGLARPHEQRNRVANVRNDEEVRGEHDRRRRRAAQPLLFHSARLVCRHHSSLRFRRCTFTLSAAATATATAAIASDAVDAAATAGDAKAGGAAKADGDARVARALARRGAGKRRQRAR
mmetsp:Transcript_10764/g.27194  ORF Transcript_10764/g.27194 Transcript_10764/m.27194 type:complete len:230 (-) Transcript_10764:1353-2042(-)